MKNFRGKRYLEEARRGVGATYKGWWGGEGITARPYIPPRKKLLFVDLSRERKPASQSISTRGKARSKKIPFRKEACLQSGFGHVSSGAIAERIKFLNEKDAGAIANGRRRRRPAWEARRYNTGKFSLEREFWQRLEREFFRCQIWLGPWLGGGGEVGKMKKSHGQPNVSPNQQKRASILFHFRNERVLCALQVRTYDLVGRDEVVLQKMGGCWCYTTFRQ